MKKLLVIIATIFSITATAQTVEEIDMLILVNKVRTDPKSFIPVVENYISSITKLSKNNVKYSYRSKPNKDINNDIIVEAQGLIIFLKKTKSVSPLELSLVLYPLVKSHAQYLDSTKQLTHNGPNGQSFNDRIKSAGLGRLFVGENCILNTSTQSNVLLQWLLDLGVSGKGHRVNIFNINYKQSAIAKIGDTWVEDFTN